MSSITDIMLEGTEFLAAGIVAQITKEQPDKNKHLKLKLRFKRKNAQPVSPYPLP